MSVFQKDIVYVDFKRNKSTFGVQISFEYGIDSFDVLRNIIKACGGSQDKDLMKWVVNGTFAFYCVDLIKSIGEVEVLCGDYFQYYLKQEMKRLEKNIHSSKAKKPSKKIDIPVNPGKQYFDFQKAAVEFFENRGRKILLADDMGVGKTITSIAIANYNKFKKILIICPDSAKEKPWKESILNWYVGDPKVQVLYAGKELKPDSDIVILNYELVSKHEAALIKSKFQYLIVDEAHLLKTTSSKRTKSVKKIADKMKAKIFLTGTPILNRPIELYSLLRIVTNSDFGTKSAYAYRYCNAKLVSLEPKGNSKWNDQNVYDSGEESNKKGKSFLDDKGESNLSELNFKLRSTIMMRRERADVIDEFPNVTRHIFQIDSEYAKRIDDKYKNEKNRYNKAISDVKKNKTAFFDYKAYTKVIKEVQQYHFDQIASIRKELGISKVKDIAKFVQALLDKGKKKIILFMHHREAIEEIHKLFPNNSVVLYGGMGAKEKSKAVDIFEKDDNINIFIGSIQASGVAYTLNVAHTVVFGELDWTPSMIDQCEARCVRLGQTCDVMIFYLIISNSLDQNMLNKIHRKGKMIKLIMI